MFQGSPLSHLPIDPTNTAGSSNFYVYVTDGRSWVLASLIESERHGSSALRDGGTDFARFEVGNNLSLWTNASGLVGYWSFDEGTGTTANDLSGLRNTGTLQPALGPTWTTGRVGGASSFDGVDDFVNVPHSASLNITGAITIEVWVNRTGTPEQFAGIVIKDNTDLGIGYGIGHAGIGVPAFKIRTGGLYQMLTFANFPLNTWRHVVATYNGSSLQVFLDGNLSVSTPASGSIATNSFPLRIGRQERAALTHFNGLIDEVRIYNRALSAAEVRAIFNATR